VARLVQFVQLAGSLGIVWWFFRNDVADYAAFKLLTRSADRQRRYLVWTFKGFALFFGLGLLNLIILGRVHASFALPPEFWTVSLPLSSLFSASPSLRTGLLVGVGGGLLAGVVLGIVLARRRLKAALPFLGDVEPLLPRNGAETACIGLMSINAGVSEELFFRLVLPLLLVSLFGSAVGCFLVAAVVFGICHWYQGLAGVIGTTVLGLVLTIVYLSTGSLFIAMAVHAGLDLFNTVVRPWLHRALSTSR
jgi:membrane protease YdiL (CAAX protease family)